MNKKTSDPTAGKHSLIIDLFVRANAVSTYSLGARTKNDKGAYIRAQNQKCMQ